MHGKRLLLFETAGSVAWFLMDASWMMKLPTAAAMFAAVALVLTAATLILHGTGTTPRHELASVAASSSWLFMNVFWMANDLYGIPDSLAEAKTFGVMGLAFLLVGALVSPDRAAALAAVSARFRRLRLGRTPPP